MKVTTIKEVVVDFWVDHYTQRGHCSLCGNLGLIDTRGTKTPAGVHVGRVNYCICPVGFILRENNMPLEQEEKKV